MIYQGIQITGDETVAKYYNYKPSKSESGVKINLRIVLWLRFFDGIRYRSVKVPESLSLNQLQEFKEYCLFHTRITSIQGLEFKLLDKMLFRRFGEFRYKLIDTLPEGDFIIV